MELLSNISKTISNSAQIVYYKTLTFISKLELIDFENEYRNAEIEYNDEIEFLNNSELEDIDEPEINSFPYASVSNNEKVKYNSISNNGEHKEFPYNSFIRNKEDDEVKNNSVYGNEYNPEYSEFNGSF